MYIWVPWNLHTGRKESVGFGSPENLPRTKRATREETTITARVATASLDILGTAGATVLEPSSAEEKPGSRMRGCHAGWDRGSLSDPSSWTIQWDEKTHHACHPGGCRGGKGSTWEHLPELIVGCGSNTRKGTLLRPRHSKSQGGCNGTRGTEPGTEGRARKVWFE